MFIQNINFSDLWLKGNPETILPVAVSVPVFLKLLFQLLSDVCFACFGVMTVHLWHVY